MTTIEVLHWAVVGTGDISDVVVPDMQLVEGARVVAVASRSASRAEAFAAKHGIARWYGDLDSMLADDEVDVVYVGTPHGTHAAIAVRALEAGKHVVVEKPLGLNAAEVESLIRTAEQQGRFLMEAMWTKFSPAFRALTETIRSGAIGEVRTVQASFGVAFPAETGSRWKPELGGSALLDQGIYPVTLARAVLGEPSRVTAAGTVRADGIDTTEFITLEYDDGRFAQLASSMTEFIDPSASIGGAEGWIRVESPFWATRAFRVHNRDFSTMFVSPERHTFEPEGFGYTPMIRAVCDAVRSGLLEHPAHPLAESSATFHLLDRVRAQLTATSEPAL